MNFYESVYYIIALCFGYYYVNSFVEERNVKIRQCQDVGHRDIIILKKHIVSVNIENEDIDVGFRFGGDIEIEKFGGK